MPNVGTVMPSVGTFHEWWPSATNNQSFLTNFPQSLIGMCSVAQNLHSLNAVHTMEVMIYCKVHTLT